MLLSDLHTTVKKLIAEFEQIPSERRTTLLKLTRFVEHKLNEGQPVYLNFICTHNSRRSHMSQLWAQTAAYYYSLPKIVCFSGGTEATAFNPNAVKAIQEAGFIVVKTTTSDNPVYEVRFAEDASPVLAFSKKYDDSFNPAENFAAIMTCSHADENCPVISGAARKMAITYTDPKEADGTPQEAVRYAEFLQQIGREILYAFAQVKT